MTIIYFFQVTVVGILSDDEEGQEFETFEAAYEDAVESGRSIVIDLIRRGSFLSHNDAIEIADAQGSVRAHLPLENLVLRPSR